MKVNELKVGNHLQVLNGDQVLLMELFCLDLRLLMSLLLMERVYQKKSPRETKFWEHNKWNGHFYNGSHKENKDTVFSKILQLVNQNQDNQTKAASIIQNLNQNM